VLGTGAGAVAVAGAGEGSGAGASSSKKNERGTEERKNECPTLGQGFKNWRQNLVQQSIKIKDENAPKAAAAYVHGIVKF